MTLTLSDIELLQKALEQHRGSIANGLLSKSLTTMLVSNDKQDFDKKINELFLGKEAEDAKLKEDITLLTAKLIMLKKDIIQKETEEALNGEEKWTHS